MSIVYTCCSLEQAPVLARRTRRRVRGNAPWYLAVGRDSGILRQSRAQCLEAHCMPMEESGNKVSEITGLLALAYAVAMFIVYYIYWGREFIEFIRATAVVD